MTEIGLYYKTRDDELSSCVEIGNITFLTRAEAEDALKRMTGQEAETMESCETVREMTFEEQYEILKKEAEELYNNEIGEYEPPFANCVVRRAMRCITALLCETETLRDRQAPKKPVTYSETNRADCPVCGSTVRGIDKPFGDYCSECGQAIDWSE